MEILKVKGPFAGGFMLINKSDFVEGEHELFTEEVEVEEVKPKVSKRLK